MKQSINLSCYCCDCYCHRHSLYAHTHTDTHKYKRKVSQLSAGGLSKVLKVVSARLSAC